MTCGNTQDALNLMHTGLPLFLYHIPHPLNVVVSLLLREFHPYSTSRPDTEFTWFTYVSPKGKNFVTRKMAKVRTHINGLVQPYFYYCCDLNIPDPVWLWSSKRHIKWENVALLSDIYSFNSKRKVVQSKACSDYSKRLSISGLHAR
jgi:hypothetical protein